MMPVFAREDALSAIYRLAKAWARSSERSILAFSRKEQSAHRNLSGGQYPKQVHEKRPSHRTKNFPGSCLTSPFNSIFIRVLETVPGSSPRSLEI